jgi:hypothetical protein
MSPAKSIRSAAVVVALVLAAAGAIAQEQGGRKAGKPKSAQLAAAVTAADAALSPGELAIAEQVHVGLLPCELGQSITITPDARSPGYFDVVTKGRKFRMYPVETSTGAVRLEDKKAGAVWIQVSNKSMLMNHKLGQRLADDCMSPAQAAVAQALAKTPGRSFMDAPEAAASAPAASAPATR